MASGASLLVWPLLFLSVRSASITCSFSVSSFHMKGEDSGCLERTSLPETMADKLHSLGLMASFIYSFKKYFCVLLLGWLLGWLLGCRHKPNKMHRLQPHGGHSGEGIRRQASFPVVLGRKLKAGDLKACCGVE